MKRVKSALGQYSQSISQFNDNTKYPSESCPCLLTHSWELLSLRSVWEKRCTCIWACAHYQPIRSEHGLAEELRRQKGPQCQHLLKNVSEHISYMRCFSWDKFLKVTSKGWGWLLSKNKNKCMVRFCKGGTTPQSNEPRYDSAFVMLKSDITVHC